MAAKGQRAKVSFAHKKVINDTQIWKQTEPECTLQNASGVHWTGVTVMEQWPSETKYRFPSAKSYWLITLHNQACLQ